jgi:hypothetical protein
MMPDTVELGLDGAVTEFQGSGICNGYVLVNHLSS